MPTKNQDAHQRAEIEEEIEARIEAALARVRRDRAASAGRASKRAKMTRFRVEVDQEQPGLDPEVREALAVAKFNDLQRQIARLTRRPHPDSPRQVARMDSSYSRDTDGEATGQHTRGLNALARSISKRSGRRSA